MSSTFPQIMPKSTADLPYLRQFMGLVPVEGDVEMDPAG